MASPNPTSKIPICHPHPHRDRRHAHRQHCRLLLLCTLQIEFSTRIRSELLAAEKHVKNKAPAECVAILVGIFNLRSLTFGTCLKSHFESK